MTHQSLDSQVVHFQEPKPPFPYRSEEVTYFNEQAGIELAGTLTLPVAKGSYSAVILIAGMGPNDRDYTMLGHKPFFVLADYLTRRGIAVLRFDKRGIGLSSGVFDLSLTSEDFAQDVLSGIAYLKTRTDLSIKNIGLIGHSEGGMIAPMVAAQSPEVAFLVLMGGVAVTSVDLVVEQVAMQFRADGASQSMVAHDRLVRAALLNAAMQENKQRLQEIIARYWEGLSDTLKHEAEQLPFAITEANAAETIAFFVSPWYRFFLTHDPRVVLQQITVPLLALNGDLDFIVSSSIALSVIAEALREANNTHFSVRELPSMNHWFQTCKTGAFAEYGELAETISETVLKIVGDWIINQS
ncbi:MAG: hypothetical protein UV38_C0001G0053 [candidate division TM6 bacterium GW2011_GWE2_42_60]|nr:MAG: hypothetical protein UV38_C0001G0053 [candidate division TM6 bacterium GW2011_GWE2_42_60]HBY05753.1 alpha/beta hydrolase [Candidatus Dependentiae bacterium]